MTRSEFELMAPKLRAEMLKVSLAFFGDGDDAEDTVQEAMLQLWRYCGQIDSGRNVTGLAVRVAKNCCVSIHRQRQLEVTCQSQISNLQSQIHEVSPHERLEARDMQHIMEETIALLKPRERQLFEMRQLEGLSNDDITRQTGIPKNSVAVMVSAARKKVFQELTKRLNQ